MGGLQRAERFDKCVCPPQRIARERIKFFCSLSHFVSQWGCHSLAIFGDFNAVLTSDERWDVNGFGSTSEELVALVEVLELQDLPFSGSKYIFFEGGSGCVRSRLDRFLIKDAETGWSERVVQQVIFKFCPNHLPILLSFVEVILGPWPSRLFNIWGENP